MSQYMVEFVLPQEMTEEFISKIPRQRLKINELMSAGKIMSYSLASDRSKLWCIVKADSEYKVMEILAEFPLIEYFNPTITELMFHNTVMALKLPLYSLN